MINRLLAQCTVAQLERAEQWYSQVLDHGVDTHPMPGLAEWHLGDNFGVQVWVDADNAGHSTVILNETDLDGAAERVTAAGIHHDGPQAGGGARILQLTDPDGNLVVFAGA